MKRLWISLLTVALLGGCGDDADEDGEGNGSPEGGSPAGAARVEYSDQEQKALLSLARRTLNAAVAGEEPPRVDEAQLGAKLKAEKGCFVTLNKAGELRGCIGYIFPNGPLYKSVMANAVNAALRDRRFRPVRMSELTEIDIEISVLTVPQPLAFQSFDDLLGKLRKDVDGVVFRAGSKQSTYLPTVWEKIPDKKAFMMALSRKANLPLPEESWTLDVVTILTYQAEVFGE